MIAFLQPTINVLVPVSIIALQLSLESYNELFESTAMDSIDEQPENAWIPMEATLFGIVIDVRDEQL